MFRRILSISLVLAALAMSTVPILAAADSARPREAGRRFPDADPDDRRDLRARADAIITYLTVH